MKILFVGQVGESLPPPYAGVPKRALMLAKKWRENGDSVGICFTHHHDQEDDLGAQASYFFEYVKKPSLLGKIFFISRQIFWHPLLYVKLLTRAIDVYGNITKDILVYAAYGVFIKGVIKLFTPDVIVGESGLHRSFYAALVAEQMNIPFVLETYAEVHDSSIVHFKTEEDRNSFWRKFLAMPQRIITPSSYCAQRPLEYAPEGRVHTVFATTLEVEKFVNDPRTQKDARENYGLPQTQFLVGAVGSFSPRKGHDHIIHAVAELRKKDLDVGAVLCGEGNPEWLRELAKKLGIENSVHFFQNLSEEDLRLLFRSLDLYCDASNTPRACLGIALTEALASHVPTIAYDVAGLPEVVAGDAGVLVPVNDIEALSIEIEKILSMSVEDRAHMGERGFVRARDVFDLEIISKQLRKHLELTYAEYGK